MLFKICGINTMEDAKQAVEWGANALGFNFYKPSPRFLQPQEAEKIMAQLPHRVMTVGIVVLDREGTVDGWEELSLDALQFYGLGHPGQIPPTRKQIWIATSPDAILDFPDHRVVVDTSWGTGRKEDWEDLRQLKRDFILSGGLTPENVGEAIRLLRPEGVDVCSGVESSPGIKDAEKMESFLRNAWASASRTTSLQGESS
jgi:phosphoribosylanthranilate isomerase